jgi:uncharacterized protein
VIHPHTTLRSADAAIGFGVFATHPIPRGTITWVRDSLDHTFTSAAREHLSALHREAIGRYVYVDRRGDWVLCWDFARFNNHSCRPACRTVSDFDIAVRDIAAGEELTIEYATVNVLHAFPCLCGDAACRGTVRPDDAQRHAEAWDREVAAAVQMIGSVGQPLEPLFGDNETLRMLWDAVADGGPLVVPSARETTVTR